MAHRKRFLVAVAVVLAMVIPVGAAAAPPPDEPATFTLLHTNDFHGRLQTDSSNRGGSAYLSAAVNEIRSEVGEENVVLLDAGDVYFAAPAISQLLMGESTIDIYNMIGYDAATFGNHEFDKGQAELAERVDQSDFPWLGANVVLEGTDWDLPSWAQPYALLDVGGITLGVLGLAGEETPEVTLLGTTAGLVFKGLTETILHYYDEVMEEADAMVVLVHMGTADSGPYDGLVTVAEDLIDAGKPVDLMIGGHQHQALFTPVTVGETTIVSAGYYGRYLGRVDVTVDPDTKDLDVVEAGLITIGGPALSDLASELDALFADEMLSKGAYASLSKKFENAMAAYDRGKQSVAANLLGALANELHALSGKQVDPDAVDSIVAGIDALIAHRYWSIDEDVAARVAYWASVVAPIVEEPVGATNIDLVRDYNDESVMGDLVTDSMLWKADSYDDGLLNGSVDGAFTNPGGLRADIVIPDGAALPYTLTWGETFDVLPFGNTLYLMDLTGAQIQELLDQSASLYKGILQSSGVNYYWYNDTGSDAATAWGAYGVTVGGEPLVRDEVYRIVTNDFLAGGQDGWVTFADGTDRWNTYYDMQQALVEYLAEIPDGVVDTADVPMGRITRLDSVVTMLHTNDTHGRWEADSYGGGFVYLADLIAKERAHNPDVLLLDAGDTFQGNSFAYFFKDRDDNPIAGGMNLLGYDAMTVGNHEFNFGPETFVTMLSQLDFPVLGAINVADDGAYGLADVPVQESTTIDVGGIDVAIFGVTNPRVYRYELPTNIPGLTFHPVVDDTAPYSMVDLQPIVDDFVDADLVVGLTHIGYAPYGDEIDSDLLVAEQVEGIDVIIGGHSHSRLDPAVMVTSTDNPDGTLIAQTGRYAGALGKVNVGFVDGEVVLREGYLIPASEAEVDADLSAYLAPYLDEIEAYNETVIGTTTVPIDALDAFTQETNAANLQADSAIYVLGEAGNDVDVHLSGAMTNRLIADGATPSSPVELTKGDMFDLMPYENSLVVLEMNGPQLKEVLERAYRNYWYYSYVPGYGGYSHYTTCMLDTDAGNVITYLDEGSGTPPTGDNVLSLEIEGVPVDFTDATTYYTVSTVNYLAAGSCNFNDGGVTLWPLDQIVADTQLYVRDSVIDYVAAQTGAIAPEIEGRLVFQSTP